MAKEFDKFNSDYKKLQPQIAKYTKDTTSTTIKNARVQFLQTNDQGEDHLTEGIAKARNNGVTGDKVADFAKDKAFSDAVKVYRLSVGDLRRQLALLETYSLEAGDVQQRVNTLVAAMQKDLKSRSGRSESKSEIEALLAEAQKPAKVLAEAAGAYAKTPKAWIDYVKNDEATIEKLIKAAPEVAQSRYDDTMLPQMLVDRNRKRLQSQALAAAQDIIKACDSAAALARTDAAAAKNALKPAADRMPVLTKVRDDFTAAFDKESQKNDFTETKDYGAIKKVKENIEKAHEAADKKVRATVAAIRSGA